MGNRTSLHTLLLALGLALAACGDDTDGSSDTTGAETTGMMGSMGPSSTGSATGPGSASTSGGSDGSSSGEASSSSGEESSDGSSSTGAVVCAAEAIELPGEAFFPEGVAADGDTLYIGSLATGEIVRASACDGEAETFVAAGVLNGAVGLRVDADRGVLWACDSDVTFTVAPALVAIDLDDGNVLATHAFGGPGFCNDVALDDDGNAYATDSTGNRVVLVAAADALEDTTVETWSADETLAVPPGEFGVNGIAWDPAGVVHVVNYFDGRLYAIAVEDDGSAGPVEELGPTGTFAAPDGILPDGDGLLVVEGGLLQLTRVDLDDLSTDVVADGFDVPATVAVVGAHAWVTQSQLDHLLGFDPDPPELPFTAVRVDL
jgi:sugar lactone lactonase YvrE